MATLSDFYSELRNHVNQCPDVTLDLALLRSMREFCRESWVYEKTILINLVAGQKFYKLDLDTNDEVINISAVEKDNVPLTPTRPQDILDTSTGSSLAYSFEPTDILVLYPTPSTTDDGTEIKVRMVLQPKETAAVIPDILLRLYKPYIVYGAISWLYDMPDEVWSDNNMAFEYRRRFEVGVGEAKGQRARGFMSRNLRAKPRSFL